MRGVRPRQGRLDCSRHPDEGRTRTPHPPNQARHAVAHEPPRLPHNDHVFPGHGRGKPRSGMAMAMQLRRINRGDITVHGFRSTFGIGPWRRRPFRTRPQKGGRNLANSSEIDELKAVMDSTDPRATMDKAVDSSSRRKSALRQATWRRSNAGKCFFRLKEVRE